MMDPVMDPKRRRLDVINTVVLPTISEHFSHHRNLNEQITSLYGREILDEFRKLEKLRVKIKRRAADLDFLKQCRDSSVLPSFACIQHQIRSRWNKSAFHALEKSIVRGEIRRNRYMLVLLSKMALKLHLKLAHELDLDV